MVSTTTGARVLVAGSVLALAVVLTLHFLFKKKKGKSEENKDDETRPKSSVNEHDPDKNSEENDQPLNTLKDNVDWVSGQLIHGKRKHPNDDFVNADIQSPKKPHETPVDNGKKEFDTEQKPEPLDFFRKELQEFLKDKEKENSPNINRNANSAEENDKKEGDKVTKQEVTLTNSQLPTEKGRKENQNGNISEELITAEVSQNVSATLSKSCASKQGTENQNGHSKDDVTEQVSDNSDSVAKRKSGNNGQTDDDQSYTRFSEEDIKDALLVSQSCPGILSGPNAQVLVSLLTHPDSKLQDAALNGINRCSTFTRNQNLFREHGCLSRLSDLLYQQRMSKTANPKVVTEVANAITNLSSNEENHKKLNDCVSTLVDLTLEDETGESVCLSSLKALTNLSLTSQHHGHYTRVVQRLYDLVDKGSANIKLQATKVLVNLSCNPELVPHMLAAKAPGCSIDLLKQDTDEELLLRWTTLLANILTTAKDQKLTSASLPADGKAPSPETMYTALYGVSNSGQLKSKVYLLSRHRNDNISHQASKAYQVITKM